MRNFLNMAVLKAAGLGPVLVVLVSSTSFADEIYKTVDEDGNVSYSTEAPADGTTQTLDTLPEPDQQDVEAAQKRQQKIEDDLQEQRQARAEQAEREAQRSTSGSSIVVVNNRPLVVPGAFHYPHHHNWRQRNSPGHGNRHSTAVPHK